MHKVSITQGEHANHYSRDAVQDLWTALEQGYITLKNITNYLFSL
jgi:hypothetical protein